MRKLCTHVQAFGHSKRRGWLTEASKIQGV
jgi:hypothetical protein